MLACVGLPVLTGCPIFPNPPPSIKKAKILARDWQPPVKPAKQQDLFPGNVAKFNLVSTRPIERWDDFDYDHQGYHARYTDPSTTIEVIVFWNLDTAKQDQLRETALQSIHKPGPHHSMFSTGSGNWQLTCRNGDLYRFFVKDGWIAAFKSTDNFDSIDFADLLLRWQTNKKTKLVPNKPAPSGLLWPSL